MPYTKPLPKVTAEDRPFWEAAKKHRLVLPRCRACGHVWLPPYASCPRCISADIEWVPASGKGTIWGCVEMHQAYMKAFRDDMPYNVALVRLEEGPLMFTNIVGAGWGDLQPDTPVEVVFDDVTEEFTLPKFRVARGGPRS